VSEPGDAAASGSAGARRLEVAVGVVVHRDGRVLLGQRVEGKPYAGWWEFPGGKIEAGESVAQALARELHEELGLDVRASHPWLIREFLYPHAHVRLHFRRIFGAWDDFSGEPQSREGQAFDWLALDNPARSPLLPASEPVFGWLRLPALIARCRLPVSAGGLSSLQPLATVPGLPAPGAGVAPMTLLETPEPLAPVPDRAWREALAKLRAAGARVLVSSNDPPGYAEAADGMLLESAALRQLSARPAHACCGARCESFADLERASALQLDFVVTASIDARTTLPLFRDDSALATAAALQGLPRAIADGAHGIVLGH
jgi:8-oxo-dGTP diphosphatase